MQNGPFDESKLKTSNGREQGAVENARDEKTQHENGETGGGIQVHVRNPVHVQTGFQSSDTSSNKEVVEVYDTISARPDTFHIITEAPLVRQEIAKEGVVACKSSTFPFLLVRSTLSPKCRTVS